jgi:hypothetical protein
VTSGSGATVGSAVAGAQAAKTIAATIRILKARKIFLDIMLLLKGFSNQS